VIGVGPLAETQKPHRPIASLSGGEWTRVAMARLLIEAPDLLLFCWVKETNLIGQKNQRSGNDHLRDPDAPRRF
jgi:ABC-type lipoprotein export system ATPase subunit